MNLREFQRILREAFFVPVIALLVLAGMLLWQVTSAQKAQRWIDRSDQVSAQLAELEGLIVDQETGLRGYELTGEQSMLAPFQAATEPIDAHFASIRQLLGGNPQQVFNLVQIHDRYQIWLGYANQVLAIPNAAANGPMNHQGKNLMDAVRSSVRVMDETEEHIRQARLKNAIVLERREIYVIVGGALLVGLILAVFSIARLRRVSRAYQASLDQSQLSADEIYESHERLQTTLHSIGDAVIVCGQDSTLEFMNPVAEELTGWKITEAAGKPLDQVFRIVNEVTGKEAENPVEKVRRLNKVIGLANHTLLLSRTGEQYAIDDSAAPIFDKNKKLAGIVLVFRDVTEKRRTDAALIASEKLAVAGRLAASIAHEIHNPLDSIANIHYLLAHETDPARRSDYLNMAQQELERTLQITRTLLNLYREPNAPVLVDLHELLSGVLLLLKRRLDNQGIEVRERFEGDFVIEGFPAELRQVFTNLILNAADAAGLEGKIGIRMSGVPAEEFRGAGVAIEVLDSGRGVSEEVAEKLFQPFFTTKGENGTGLGLWVSMGIVQKHGGSIRMDNSIDPGFRGACVRVYLPAHTLATPSSRTTVHLG